jgi:hypothetical protein
MLLLLVAVADRYRLMEDQMADLDFIQDPFVVVAAIGESLAYAGRHVQCIRVLRSALHLATAATCTRCCRPRSPSDDSTTRPNSGPPTAGRSRSSGSPSSATSSPSQSTCDSGTDLSSPLPPLADRCSFSPAGDAAVGCSARYLVLDWTLSCLVLTCWTLGDREQAVQFARRRLTTAESRGSRKFILLARLACSMHACFSPSVRRSLIVICCTL